jgi:hypothetical protein
LKRKGTPEKLEENTVKKYRTTLKHLQAFRKQIFFSDIDSDLLREFLRQVLKDQEHGNIIAEGAILYKMMGHTKQETTKHYYKKHIPEIVEGTKWLTLQA